MNCMKKNVLLITICAILMPCTYARAEYRGGSNPSFVQEGIGYLILSEEAHTVAVCGTNDSELTYVDVPEKIVHEGTEYSVTIIAEKAFYSCSKLEQVHLPETLTSIASGAFSDCFALQEIIIPHSVTDIGAGSFSGCYNLRKVRMPNDLVSVGSDAFKGTKIDSITILANVQYDGYVYSEAKQTKAITIESGVREIPDGMFAGRMEAGIACYVIGCENIVLPNTLEKIGPCAFRLNRLSSVNIPESCIEIDSAAFSACPFLEKISLPTTLKYLGKCAFFSNYSLKEAYIPASVKTLQIGVFAECENLEKIIIHSETVEHFFSVDNALTQGASGIDKQHVMEHEPLMSTIVFGKEVKRITLGNNREGNNGMPFGKHAKIQNVYCEGTVPPEGGIYQAGATLHVPIGCKELYATAEIWKLYGENIVDDINLEGIHNAQLKTQDSDAPTYDLPGRRVENPKQGEIYIRNGKKTAY